jgi:nicotinate-nucleotide pyrophosphorylase (carboxylating)
MRPPEPSTGAIDPLDLSSYRDLVRRALAEDIGAGDVTTKACVPSDSRARGVFVAKARCVVAGLDVAVEAFRQLEAGVAVDVHIADGERCEPGTTIAEVRGATATLLTGERTALNLLQRLSGIATFTRQFVHAAAGQITVLDTRKTTPTLRALEKYAVRAGGGSNHRFGLFDAVLIKDNHIRMAGGISRAVSAARAGNAGLAIEVEAETQDQVDEAIAAGADTILLDNMTTAEIRRAVTTIAGRAKVEISGGVTIERIAELANTGAEFVSVGALTHSAPAVDISFEITAI